MDLSRMPAYMTGDFNRRPAQIDPRAQYSLVTPTSRDERAPSSCYDDCSLQSCDDDCSFNRCSSCAKNSGYYEGSLRTSLDSGETSHPNSLLPGGVESDRPTSYGHAPGFGNDSSNHSLNAGANDLQQCFWLMTDQQCNVAVPTRNALGQHVFRDHIEPQDTIVCPVQTCAAVLNAQQAPNHLMQQHHPESYNTCPGQYCGTTFRNHGEVQNHLTTAHGLVDCHWGGCEVSTNSPVQLRSHFDQDHLNSSEQFPQSQPSWWDQPMPPSHHEGQIQQGQNLGFGPQSFPDAQTSPFVTAQSQTVQEGSTSPFLNIFNSSESGSFLSTESALSTTTNPEAFHQTLSQTANQFNDYPDADHRPMANDQSEVAGVTSRCMWVMESVTGQVCGMTFADGNQLQAHAEECHVTPTGDHEGEKLRCCNWYDCKRKGTPLQTKEKLKRHLFTHTKYWTASCSYCSKHFNNTAALDNHERVHRGEKPFVCGTCKRKFTTEASLTTHKRSHTGEKPLSCGRCGYVSADSSNMSKHKLTHGPPGINCPICKRAFARKSTMKRHLRVHDEARRERLRLLRQQRA